MTKIILYMAALNLHGAAPSREYTVINARHTALWGPNIDTEYTVLWDKRPELSAEPG